MLEQITKKASALREEMELYLSQNWHIKIDYYIVFVENYEPSVPDHIGGTPEQSEEGCGPAFNYTILDTIRMEIISVEDCEYCKDHIESRIIEEMKFNKQSV